MAFEHSPRTAEVGRESRAMRTDEVKQRDLIMEQSASPSRVAGIPFALLALLALGCAHSQPPPSLTRNLDLEEFEQAVRFKDPCSKPQRNI
jgi:hypothetical protein